MILRISVFQPSCLLEQIPKRSESKREKEKKYINKKGRQNDASDK